MTTPRAVRYRCDLKARLTASTEIISVRVLELSEAGAFVARLDGAEPPSLDLSVELTLALPTGDLLPLPARVARIGTAQREVSTSKADHVTVAVFGCGLAFRELADEPLERLRDYLELLDER